MANGLRTRRATTSTSASPIPAGADSGKKGKKGGRKKYAHQACNVCRHKHAPCDEARPICSTCRKTGREAECSYERVTVRKPRTEAHFEAMRNRIEALRSYSALLESLVEKCRREHGSESTNSPSSMEYLQFRPAVDPVNDPETQSPMIEDDTMLDDTSDGAGSEEDDVALELCLPTSTLKLEDRDLVFYGIAAPFRFATENQYHEPSRSTRFPIIDQNPKLRYVLLVDGTDETFCNPDFDWSRHLPAEVPLERREHDMLLDRLFKFFTSWCLRIVPTLFLRDMYRSLSLPPSHSPPNTTHYSPMLHNALLALATAFSDDPRIRDFRSRMYFVEATKRWLDTECRKPNICVVHALSILASFYSSNGEQMLGYMYFGMSARISQALGLSINSSEWVKSGRISQDDMLDRNWAHWTTFSQDACWSLYVGRDFAVPIPSPNIPIPFVDTEHDQIPWEHPTVPSQPNMLSRTLKASCELLMIARKVMEVVTGMYTSGSRREVNDELVSQIDLQLHNWKRLLPPEVEITMANKGTSTPHRLMTHLAYHWTFILLHRPFFHHKKRAGNDLDHAKTCKRAAEQIMDLVATWDKLYTLRYVPITFIQVVFAAGTIFLLSAVQATSGFRVAKESLKTNVSQAELCIEYLGEKIARSWKCSTTIAEILRHLLHNQLKPILEKRLKVKPSVGGNSAEVALPVTSAAIAPQIPVDLNTPDQSGWMTFDPRLGLGLEGMTSDRPSLPYAGMPNASSFGAFESFGVPAIDPFGGGGFLPPSAFDLSSANTFPDYQGQVESLLLSDQLMPPDMTGQSAQMDIPEADYLALEQLLTQHFAS